MAAGCWHCFTDTSLRLKQVVRGLNNCSIQSGSHQLGKVWAWLIWHVIYIWLQWGSGLQWEAAGATRSLALLKAMKWNKNPRPQRTLLFCLSQKPSSVPALSGCWVGVRPEWLGHQGTSASRSNYHVLCKASLNQAKSSKSSQFN